MKQFLIVLAVFVQLTAVCAQTPKNAITDSQEIKGRFVFKGAACAGFEFIGNKKIIWRNEIACSSPDTLSIVWIDSKIFITKDINRIGVDQGCPPRNSIYKIVVYDGKVLKLEEIWTGWGEYKTETLEFTRWMLK